MKRILIVYTGFMFGLIVTSVLYSLRTSVLDQTVSDINPTLVQHLIPSSTGQEVHRLSAATTITDPQAFRHCFQTAMRCPDVGDCHCKAKCGLSFEEIKIIEEESDIIYLDQKLGPGTYCLPTTPIPCPRAYAYTLYDGSGQSTCLCKYPHLFAGPLCSDKQMCHKGRLVSTATGEPWNETTPIATDDYYCQCDARDKRGNKRVRLPGDQLNCVSDPCLTWMTRAPEGIGMDETTGLCHCGTRSEHRVDNLYPGNLNSPCTPCYVKWITPDEVSIPLRCVYAQGIPHSAPPCRQFKENSHQCDQPSSVKISILH